MWPASRARQPKQLLPLVGDRSLIGDTIARVVELDAAAPPVIVTNEAHAVGIERVMRDQGLDNVTLVIEPIGRNTAPAVAAAALAVSGDEPDALMLILPSDHAIADAAAFRRAVEHAGRLAQDGRLVTFGIRPTSPETGFGYIRAGDEIDEGSAAVDEFVEKPDEDTARRYLASGDYSWNSGMFCFAATTYLDELRRHRPDIHDAVATTLAASRRDEGRILLDAATFAACPAESIDYAVMEPTDRAAVIPIDPGWSDVGSWTALWDISSKDPDGNVIEGDVVLHATRDSLIHSHDRLVAVAGLDGAVVVDTADAVLVTTLEASQGVKKIVETLDAGNRTETQNSDWEPRSWGTVTATSHVPGLHSWVVTVDPGASTDPRLVDGTVFLRLVDGSGTATVGGDTRAFVQERAIQVPPATPWALGNESDSDLTVSVILVDTVLESAVDMQEDS